MPFFISYYDYKIIHTKKVELADFLSRLRIREETGNSSISEHYVQQITEGSILPEQVEKVTSEDGLLQKVIQWVKYGWPEKLDSEHNICVTIFFCKNNN